MTRNVVVAMIVTVVIAGFVLTAKVLTGSPAPPITGYTEGHKISFIHTEMSNPQIADLLTKMTDSPVLVVSSLADAPDSMLAKLYVFANGIKGGGPFGCQPDVFDNPPGTDG